MTTEDDDKTAKISALRARADFLRDDAEHLRDQAYRLEDEADTLEAEADEIENDLSASGELFRASEAAMWGEDIARLIYKHDMRTYFTIDGQGWMSSGPTGWRTEAIPEDCRRQGENASLKSGVVGQGRGHRPHRGARRARVVAG